MSLSLIFYTLALISKSPPMCSFSWSMPAKGLGKQIQRSSWKLLKRPVTSLRKVNWCTDHKRSCHETPSSQADRKLSAQNHRLPLQSSSGCQHNEQHLSNLRWVPSCSCLKQRAMVNAATGPCIKDESWNNVKVHMNECISARLWVFVCVCLFQWTGRRHTALTASFISSLCHSFSLFLHLTEIKEQNKRKTHPLPVSSLPYFKGG